MSTKAHQAKNITYLFTTFSSEDDNFKVILIKHILDLALIN